MSKRIISLIFCFSLIVVLISYIVIYRNEIETTKDLVVSFSEKTGFYNQEFELELSAPEGVMIYYTVDGSEPDSSSFVYSKPIHIDDASYHENVYCMNENISAGFLDEYINEYCPEFMPDYKIPDYKIDKSTVVRAIAIDNEGHKGKVYTQNYFMNYKNKKGYDNVYYVCINSDPKNFFDYEDGIFVLGKSFDDYLNSEQWELDKKERFDTWDNWIGNYSLEKETACDIQIMNSEGKVILSDKGLVSVKGDSSVSFYQKSMAVTCNGPGAELFGDGHVVDSFCLESGGQDDIVKIRDRLVYDLCSSRNIITRNYIPCVVFIDGEYWGYYHISQKLNKNYFEEYKEIKPADLVVVKNNGLKFGVPEDEIQYMELMEFIKKEDMTVEENYEYVCKKIDIDSYIDWICIEDLVQNHDCDGRNDSQWKMRNSAEFLESKWRYILFDVNSYSMKGEKREPLELMLGKSEILRSLYRNNEFKKKLNESYDEIKELLSPEIISNYIDEYKTKNLENLSTSYKRYYGSDGYDTINEELDSIVQFWSN